MLKGILIALFLALVSSLPVQADELTDSKTAHNHKDDKTYEGQLTFHHCGATTVFKRLPRFEDYPAEHPARKIAKDIDWRSHKSAWAFRTRLREGLKRGPNFNGHYAVVEFGCGTSCQGQFIVDVETGKVLDRPRAGSSYGVTYRLSSSLFAADLPDADAQWRDYSLLRYGGPRFYRVRNRRLIHLKDLDVSSVEQSGSSHCDEGGGKRKARG